MDRAWASSDPWLFEHPPEIEWLGVYPNFAVDPGHELVQVVRDAHEAVAGYKPVITSMPAGVRRDVLFTARHSGGGVRARRPGRRPHGRRGRRYGAARPRRQGVRAGRPELVPLTAGRR